MRQYLLFMQMGYLLSLDIQLLFIRYRMARLKLEIKCLEWLRRKIK
jgi:hypothetical protein